MEDARNPLRTDGFDENVNDCPRREVPDWVEPASTGRR
jgi:hypothetical protein